MADEDDGQGADEPTKLHATYRRRLDERSRALDQWTKRDRRVADARLIACAAGVAMALRDLQWRPYKLVVADRSRWNFRRAGSIS